MTGAQAVPGALLTGAAGWMFVIFAVLALGMAIAVVVARNPIHSALFLLSSFLLVACIFILQQAEFVGAVQILVYAGGIMVLFLFGYIWFRSTFPRYRFDQLMALGWKWLIPISLANIVIVACAILATPGRSNGMFVLSYIFGGLFVVMFLLAKLRQKLARRERLAAIPASAVE